MLLTTRPAQTASTIDPTTTAATGRSRSAGGGGTLLALALGLAPLMAGCSSSAIVAGNLVSMVATFALFYTTINLRR